MGRIVIPTAADWANVNLQDGACLVEGRLAELLHPELWEGCVGAWSHALDPHPWDYSERNHTGSRKNGVADRAEGWFFDASNDYMEVSSSPDFDEVESTWVVTFRTDGNFGSGVGSSTSFLIGRGDSNGSENGLNIRMSTSGAIAFESKDNANNRPFSIVSSAVYADEKHHTAVGISAQNGGTAAFWIDGILIGSETASHTWSFNANVIRFAAAIDTFWGQYGGLIGEGRVYNRQFSAVEAQRIAERPNIAYECRLLPKVFAVPDVGGIVVTPPPAVAASSVIAPTVILGSITFTPEVAPAAGAAVAPQVVLGSVTVTPDGAAAASAAIDPAVVQGAITVTPPPAEVVSAALPPGVVLGSVTVTPPPAAGASAALDPGVVLGSVTVTPDPAIAASAAIAPIIAGGFQPAPYYYQFLAAAGGA